jgi:hypothetical protein
MEKKNIDKFIAEVSKNDSNLMNAYVLTYLNQYSPFARRCLYFSSSLLWLLGAYNKFLIVDKRHLTAALSMIANLSIHKTIIVSRHDS